MTFFSTPPHYSYVTFCKDISGGELLLLSLSSISYSCAPLLEDNIRMPDIAGDTKSTEYSISCLTTWLDDWELLRSWIGYILSSVYEKMRFISYFWAISVVWRLRSRRRVTGPISSPDRSTTHIEGELQPNLFNQIKSLVFVCYVPIH